MNIICSATLERRDDDDYRGLRAVINIISLRRCESTLVSTEQAAAAGERENEESVRAG